MLCQKNMFLFVSFNIKGIVMCSIFRKQLEDTQNFSEAIIDGRKKGYIFISTNPMNYTCVIELYMCD